MLTCLKGRGKTHADNQTPHLRLGFGSNTPGPFLSLGVRMEIEHTFRFKVLQRRHVSLSRSSISSPMDLSRDGPIRLRLSGGSNGSTSISIELEL